MTNRLYLTAATLLFTFVGSIYGCGNSAKNDASNSAPKPTETMNKTASTDTNKNLQTAIFAGGCFWGMQYYFEKAKGVTNTVVGYIGGHIDNPTYEEVCSHTSGHYEAIKVTFDPTITTYEDLARLFFNIHDPTQTNGQGPDIGEQYQSVVFYADSVQKQTAQNLIDQLTKKGLKIATVLKPATTFYSAEGYHQHHYDHNGQTPYCHRYEDKFN
jgi:peptide methionine sulfoxide reductase msrA/msrB